MVAKRLRKIKAIQSGIMPPQRDGDEQPEITFVTWGTTKGAVLSAAQILRAKGKKVVVVSYPWVFPFPVEETKTLLSSSSRVIDVEQNATGQLAYLIRAETGIDIQEKFLKSDGRPWLPEEIVDRIK